MNAQLNLLDEIIVDNFAGGGGASTGIELATGRPVTIAINHDPAAILMHKTNHPYTTHYQESVWDIDPRKVCAGRSVGLAWFSPDCKHFSKAKGGKPVEKKIRGLAWIVLKWAGLVRPRVIILENVEEFQTWGPVRKGRPVKSKQGITFRKWKEQLADLGYVIEHRELVAADFGAPTIRNRFFLIARCDGQPIVWPEPTHAPRNSEEVKAGKKLPWRSAAETIDWNLPCPSIFASKAEIKKQYGVTAVRPLAQNTMRRVARGMDKFVLHSAEPFIVQCNHGGDGFRGQDVHDPMQTVTGKHGYGVVDAVVTPWTVTNTTNSTGHTPDEPIDTARTGGGGGQMLVTPCMIQYHTEQSEKVRGQAVNEPIMTLDAANRYGLASAFLTEYYGNGQPLNVADPLHTSTSHDRQGLTLAHISKYYGGVVGAPMENPLPTATAIDHNALQVAHVCKFKGQDLGQEPQTPLHTITTSAGTYAVIRTEIVKAEPGAKLYHWPEVREMLNTYCGYEMAEDDLLLIVIDGTAYFIADIGLRMLSPRELYAANGFPADYIIDRDYMGNEYKKSQQVARCGNAVPPPFATALVRANLPEWCDRKIETMQELESVVAV